MKLTAIFGGTFDPVHLGHLAVAEEVRARLACDRLVFLIAKSPPLRGVPGARPEQRLAMLKLAVAAHPEFEVDARELERSGPSYTVLSLEALRDEMDDDAALVWVLGQDAYAGLPRWLRWRELLELGHLAVLERHGAVEDPKALRDLARMHATNNVEDLRAKRSGCIYHLRQAPVDISATEVRALVSQGRSAEHLLPSSVWAYITANGLYGWHGAEPGS
ncbi:MAG: nicotinate-nucleotide adenylyltransferase [Pseudomonadales bacterium]